MRHASLSELQDALIPAAGVHAAEIGTLARAVRTGALRRIHRGWYIETAVWQELWAESRHLAHVLAVAGSERGAGPVFSHVSAACLWGLPLYRLNPTRVHITTGATARHSIPDVFRHEGALPEGDVVEVAGMRCTSLARTALDLARTLPSPAALAVVDAALTLAGGGDVRRLDDAGSERLRDELSRRAAAPGARGVRQARELLIWGDGRAEKPLESVTRHHLLHLGFARPELQVPVHAPSGGTWWVDLGLSDDSTLIEVDGAAKYTDEALRGGRTTEEVLLAEKHREDWIRGVTRRALVRVTDADLGSPGILRSRLAAFRIHPPRP